MLDQSVNPGDPPPNPQDFAIVVGIDHYPDFLCLRARPRTRKTSSPGCWTRSAAACPGRIARPSSPRTTPPVPPGGATAWRTSNHACPSKPISIKPSKRSARSSARGRAGGSTSISAAMVSGATRSAPTCAWPSGRRTSGANAALDSEDYQKKVIASGYFRELVFFLDCCRVREVNARGRGSEFDWPMTGEGARAGQVRTFVGFATEFSNPAREAVVAGATDEGGRPPRGYFTRALLDALRGGAARTGGGVTASELKKYLERETPLLAQRDKWAQKPEVINGMSAVEGEEPVFGRYPPRARFLFHFRNHHRGPIVLEGPDTQMIQRWNASQSPVEHSLSAGWLYVLRDEATGDEKVLRVRAVEGLSHVEF